MTSFAHTQFGRWAARALFFVSVFALLATSPRRWQASAKIDGPTRATSDKGLDVAIDASSEPTLVTEVHGQGTSTASCVARWKLGSTLHCLLPPDAALKSVEIRGVCDGCSDECVPPRAAFVNVATRETEIWSDTVTSKLSAKLPSHDPLHPLLTDTTFKVRVSGAPFIDVKLEVTRTSDGAPLFRREQVCAPEPAAAEKTTALCVFYVPDAAATQGTSAEVVAEATGWGAPCANDVHPPCGPPKTLRIDSLYLEDHP